MEKTNKHMRISFKYLFYLLLLSPLVFFSCIGDDIIDDEVDPVLNIINPIDTLAFDSSYQFKIQYFNNIGREEIASNINWSSSDATIISVDDKGLAKAMGEGGAVIRASTMLDGKSIGDQIFVNVGEKTNEVSTDERTGSLTTKSSYELEGDFTLSMVNGKLVLALAENYKTTDVLPGLYIYLANNPNTNNGAFEIGEVTIFSGAHSYTIGSGVEINDYAYVLYYCKPFSAKVGEGKFDN